MDSLDEDNPWYYEDSPFGGPIVHPGILHNRSHEAVLRRFPIGVSPGQPAFHAKQESEFYNPVLVGKKIRVEVRMRPKYVKRNRNYIVIEAQSTDEDGMPLLLYRAVRMVGIRGAK